VSTSKATISFITKILLCICIPIPIYTSRYSAFSLNGCGTSVSFSVRNHCNKNIFIFFITEIKNNLMLERFMKPDDRISEVFLFI